MKRIVSCRAPIYSHTPKFLDLKNEFWLSYEIFIADIETRFFYSVEISVHLLISKIMLNTTHNSINLHVIKICR